MAAHVRTATTTRPNECMTTPLNGYHFIEWKLTLIINSNNKFIRRTPYLESVWMRMSSNTPMANVLSVDGVCIIHWEETTASERTSNNIAQLGRWMESFLVVYTFLRMFGFLLLDGLVAKAFKNKKIISLEECLWSVYLFLNMIFFVVDTYN